MSLNTPGYSLTPSAVKAALPSNYLTDFNFLNQYLPDTYEQEFERYGNRSVASFLRNVSAEIPSASDLIKWSEQGRLHTKYTGVTATTSVGTPAAGQQTFDIGTGTCVFRKGQTVILSSASANQLWKAIIVDMPTGATDTFTVAYYSAPSATPGFTSGTADVIAFVYGSEFKKGDVGMAGSLESVNEFFDVKPIIIKDKYSVSGSDMAQIGWVEVSTENGATGYLWYLKSEHETRLRFEDYMEMMMVEHVKAEASSGALAYLTQSNSNVQPGGAGTQGLFAAVEARGNTWSGGNPTTLADFDAIVDRLDKQGAIAENTIFVNREFSFDIDDMLGSVNAAFAGGTSFGLFDNDKEMALNLGFTGFRRGYDFYKSDWKYLNDATLRGGLTAGNINGVLIPAGTTSVYDEVIGKNMKRPFLHVRYRANEAENRKLKTWTTGSAGGAATSDLDAMEVQFLSERALCTLGANNFVLFKD
jgi:hypothetical protein